MGFLAPYGVFVGLRPQAFSRSLIENIFFTDFYFYAVPSEKKFAQNS
jgi:hypothetical protein